MKTVLVLGGGFLQTFVIRTAQKMGYRVAVLDRDLFAPGLCMADAAMPLDITNEEACLAFARSQRIDGVLTAATEYGVLTAARIAEELGLPGLPYGTARRIRDKGHVRDRLTEAGLSDIAYAVLTQTDSLENAAVRVGYPLMIKPCDGSGSRAVRRVNNKVELAQAFQAAMCASRTKRVLLERFIAGEEWGAELLVEGGRPQLLGTFRKHMTPPPYYAELGHVLSDDDSEKTIGRTALRAVKALGIDYGAVNLDMLLQPDGQVCIVDVGARMGGNLIGSHLIPIGTGFPYMESLIRLALAEPLPSGGRESQPVASRVLALSPGRIKTLPDVERMARESQVEILHTLRPGRLLSTYHTNADGCGYIIATALSGQAAAARAETVLQRIDRMIQRF